jgi:hypothetical protein
MLDLYKLDKYGYPNSEQGLEVLVGPYLKTMTTTTSNSISVNPALCFITELLLFPVANIFVLIVTTLSMNLAKPSAVKSLKVKIQNHIASTQNHLK